MNLEISVNNTANYTDFGITLTARHFTVFCILFQHLHQVFNAYIDVRVKYLIKVAFIMEK